MRRRIPLLPIVAGLAAVTLIAAICTLIALENGGEARIGPLVLMKIAAGYDRKAAALIDGRSPSKAEASLSEALSRKAIAEYPEDVSAWLRLASLDVIEHGVLGAAGVADLRRSYDFVAADPQHGLWRVRFALENTYALPADLKEQVHAEVKALWRQPDRRDALLHMLGEMVNPAARMTLATWLIQLELGVAQ